VFFIVINSFFCPISHYGTTAHKKSDGQHFIRQNKKTAGITLLAEGGSSMTCNNDISKARIDTMRALALLIIVAEIKLARFPSAKDKANAFPFILQCVR
jgi:hypothetical protein